MKTYVNTANHGSLNMRENPSSGAKVLTHIPYKTILDAEAVNDEWSRVSYNSVTGYVKTEFLSETKVVTQEELQEVYDSLKNVLKTIEKILK